MTEGPGRTTERPPNDVDVLSEVLRAVRLRGAVFYDITASDPWVAEAPHAREMAPHVMPGAEHVIEYHVVTSGSCWGGLVGEPAVRLEPGDILVFPQGDPHVLASAAGMRGPPQIHAAVGQRLPIRMDIGGAGRDKVHVVCGFLACDARPFNPLLAALPRIIHMKKQGGPEGEMLEHFMKCALVESSAPRAGGEVILARLSELMFVEVIRRYVLSVGPTHPGWLAGLCDDVVGRALAALHARPAHPWTLEGLAREVGASRSALAERFAAFVEVPPMQYLAQWRMQLAATLLEGSSMLAKIAEDVGYGSEAAFSRAFKKIVGVSPAAWRATRGGKAPRADRPRP
ncbi:MAG: AraC family transcriptional regulator [Labilithrix sp.]|nr:AraC family transcriptional regulator [Labilithrix sp.]